MDKLQYKFEVFEGPLDLLLSLITKHKLDIYDIPIAMLLQQYMEYMDEAKRRDMELCSEFLEMAARLVQIKSAMLLPTEEEADALKQELSGELIEYRLCKIASARLGEKYLGEVYFVREAAPMEIDMTYTRKHHKTELYNAYCRAAVRLQRRKPPKAERFTEIVDRPVVSVTGRIVYIMKTLVKKGSVTFQYLFSKKRSRPETVVVFIALLELIRSGRVKLDEKDNITLVKKKRGTL